MYDLLVVILLQIALLQLLGRRLPDVSPVEPRLAPPRRPRVRLSLESARRMVERAYSAPRERRLPL